MFTHTPPVPLFKLLFTPEGELAEVIRIKTWAEDSRFVYGTIDFMLELLPGADRSCIQNCASEASPQLKRIDRDNTHESVFEAIGGRVDANLLFDRLLEAAA